MSMLRPATVCRHLLDALEASEGRRRRRKRDTRPDAIGLGIKRTLLEAAVADDPDPDAFEAWLLERTLEDGAAQAMAREILAEVRLAAASPAFRAWLEAGAESADR